MTPYASAIGIYGRDRLTEFVEPRISRSDGCWLWTGATDGDRGYGRVRPRDEGPQLLAHRVVYELLVGAIPPELQLDHLCRNTTCVNPSHLEPVTAQINSLRSMSPSAVSVRTGACKYGHAYTADNTSIAKERSGYTYRRCRTCENARASRYRKRERTSGKARRGRAGR